MTAEAYKVHNSAFFSTPAVLVSLMAQFAYKVMCQLHAHDGLADVLTSSKVPCSAVGNSMKFTRLGW